MIHHLSTALFTMTLLFFGMSSTVAEQGNKVPEWLPSCFRGATIREVMGCVQRHASPRCFKGDGGSIRDVADCVRDTLDDDNIGPDTDDSGRGKIRRAFFNATRDCLEPYAECVYESIEERVEQMPPCVKETLRGLGRCARRNNATCAGNCRAALPLSNPYANLTVEDVILCSGVQENVMDPACEAADCCEECEDKFENVMNCIVNDVMDFTIGECTLTCGDDSSRTRFLQELPLLPQEETWMELAAHTTINSRALDATNSDDAIAEACSQYAPGLTGTDELEFSSRVPFFIPCVLSQFVTVAEQAAEEENNDGDGDDAGSSIGQYSMLLGASTAFISAFLA